MKYIESSDNIVVRADGVTLYPNASGWYQIDFVDKDIQITVSGVDYNTYTLGSIPNQVTITNEDGEKYVSNNEVKYGTKVFITYAESENCVMSEFKINGVEISNNIEFKITEDITITYSEENAYGMEFVKVGNGYSVSNTTDKSIENAIIPSRVYNEQVVAISSSAFEDCSNLEFLHIPSTVESVGGKAFRNCVNLKTLTLSENVTKIEHGTFENCSSLESLELPSNLQSIGYNAFKDCSQLISVTLPDSVIIIQDGAFMNASSLNTVVLSNGLTSISDRMFSGCTSLATINIPESVVSIGANAFMNARNLRAVTIPNSVTLISTSAFIYCDLDSFTISSSVAYETSTISWRKATTIIRVDTSIVESSSSTPYSNYIRMKNDTYTYFRVANTDLTSFSVPTGITTICESAFVNCTNLESVTLPSTVTTIEASAFEGLTSLTTVDGLEYAMTIGANAFKNSGLSGDIALNVEIISESAFENCVGITSVDGSDLLYEIGNKAFKGCTSLGEVYSVVTEVGESAFEDCSSLASIKVGDWITDIGANAFKNCAKLTSIYYVVDEGGTDISYNGLPDIERVGDSAFENCSKLKLTNFATSVSSYEIGASAFKNSGINGSLTIKSGATLGTSAFENCVNLTEVTANVLSKSAFAGCIGITKLQVYCSNVPASAFKGCTGFTSVSLSSVTEIGDSAFEDCSSLASLSEVQYLTTIGESAFKNCTSLISISYEDDPSMDGNDVSINEFTNVKTIGASAFENCSKLYIFPLDYFYPSQITSIDSTSFKGCNFNYISTSNLLIANAINGSWLGSSAVISLGSSTASSMTNAYLTSTYCAIINDGYKYYYPKTNTSLNFGYGSPTKIPANTFKGLTKLQSITFEYNSNITEIGASAFAGCTNLETIEFNQSSSSKLTTIGALAFSGCSKLSELTIPSSITTLGDSAFAYCTGLTTITIPATVTTLGSYVFSDCEGITEATINSNVGEYMFDWCTNLKTVNINGEEVGAYGFATCIALENVNFGTSVKTVGDYAFACEYGDDAITTLTDIDFNLVTTLGNYLFDGRWVENIYTSDSGGFFYHLDSLAPFVASWSGNSCVRYINVEQRSSLYPSSDVLVNDLYLVPDDYITGSTYVYDISGASISTTSYSLRRTTVVNNIEVTSVEDYNNSDTSWLENAIQVTVLKSIVDDSSNSNSYLTTDNFIIFQDDEYYYYIAKSAIDESVEYTQIVTYDGAVYVGTDDDPYHTFLYNE